MIGILLVTNIALAAILLMGNDGKKKDRRPDRKAMIAEFLKNDIGFSPEQLLQYDTLSTHHQENMKKTFEGLRGSKDKQFRQLAAGDFSDSVISLVANESAETQKMMELTMFNHLKKVRMLCTPEQLPKFDSLFSKVLNRRGEGRREGRERGNKQ